MSEHARGSGFPRLVVLALTNTPLHAERIPALTRAHEYAYLVRERAVVSTSVDAADPSRVGIEGWDAVTARWGADAVFVVGAVTDPVRSAIERSAGHRGCLVAFEDDAIAVAVAVRAASALRRHHRHDGRGRVAVVFAAICPAVTPLLHALDTGEVTEWHPRSAATISFTEVVATHDVVVNLMLHETLDHPTISRSIGYPREALHVCGPIIPPLIGTLCDSDAAVVTVPVWAAVARALDAISWTHPEPEWADAAMSIAASVRQQLNSPADEPITAAIETVRFWNGPPPRS